MGLSHINKREGEATRGHSRRKHRVTKGMGVLYKGLFDKKWIKKSENSKSSLLLDTNDQFYPIGNCELLNTFEHDDHHASKLL